MLTRDQVLALMAQAGAGPDDPRPKDYGGIADTFARFAALVAGGEREACAVACEDVDYPNHETAGGAITECARVIRARSKP